MTVTKVVVVGTGAFGQGLCSLAIRSGACASYSVSLASRRVSKKDAAAGLPSLPGIPLVSIDAALEDADMVVLAVPTSAYPGLLKQHGDELKNKVIIDICNPWGADLDRLYSCSSSGDVEAVRDSSGNSISSDVAGICKDPSSSPCPKGSSAAGWLQAQLGTTTPVVKAFNNLSAYQLIHGDPLTEHFKTVAATNDEDAAAQVQAFAMALGMECRKVPSLAYASKMEARHKGLMPEWQTAMWVTLITWALTHVYSFIRYNEYGKTKWTTVVMWITNKSVAWTALWLMMYTFLPGVIVCYMQLIKRRGTVRIPAWLKCWMDVRKQLGLLALLLTVLHLLFSIFLFMPSYYAKLWEQDDHVLMATTAGAKVNKFGLTKQAPLIANPKTPSVTLLPSGVVAYSQVANATTVAQSGTVFLRTIANNATALNATKAVVIRNVGGLITLGSRLNKWGETSMFTGILAGVLMALTGFTSLPSITPKLNWREWRLLQPSFSWWCIIISEVHVLLLGAKAWPKYKTEWPKLIPTITLMSTVPVMALLLAKGLLVLPPLSIILRRIRSGKLGCASEIADYAVLNDAYETK